MKSGRLWLTLSAEVSKQHRNRVRGRSVFFSLLLWPVLTFLTSYYTMLPFRSGEGSALSRVIPDGQLPLFLLSGYLVFQLFWTVVQAAWLFGLERKDGTLEMIFLTPASKMAFLYGRSVYSLFHGIWMFAVFSLLTFWFVADVSPVKWGALLSALLLILISAVIWGAALCAVSLFSRDSGLLYYIFQAPMELFGGVRIPPTVFPAWATGFSLLFPVTYSLILVRGALYGDIGRSWWWALAVLIAGNLALIGCTRFILSRAERHARIKGNWHLF
ncbi:multidrug ABC transporter permease [Paenibacillus albidus]|uniref:Multidrug ABC transporter permease n=1 Tax=Paenibacillus albidus TaxID=2041023 RepID=A0A917C0Q7_9BACL|nr:ABC transporter permease [Paenibacillus albidus]GGF64454.1 multidrug ABC transporter permease [Paenibacillus albidus]